MSQQKTGKTKSKSAVITESRTRLRSGVAAGKKGDNITTRPPSGGLDIIN